VCDDLGDLDLVWHLALPLGNAGGQSHLATASVVGHPEGAQAVLASLQTDDVVPPRVLLLHHLQLQLAFVAHEHHIEVEPVQLPGNADLAEPPAEEDWCELKLVALDPSATRNLSFDKSCNIGSNDHAPHAGYNLRSIEPLRVHLIIENKSPSGSLAVITRFEQSKVHLHLLIVLDD
jgi:hypothetical protein